MKFSLSDEQRSLVTTLDSMLSRMGSVEVTRAVIESDTASNPKVWASLASELGLTALAASEESGGVGFLPIELCAALQVFGSHVVAAPLRSTIVATRLLSQCEPSETRDALLDGAFDGTAKLAEAVSATHSISATHHDGQVSLTGEIRNVPYGEEVDGVVITAPLDDKPALLYLAATSATVVPHATALDPSQRLAHLTFSDAEATILATPGTLDDVIAEAQMLARLLLAAEQVGVASASLELGSNWAREREQFSRPIGSFQAIKHRLASVHSEVESAWTLLYLAAWSLLHSEPTAESDVDDALLAAHGAATFAAGSALQVHGGIGFTWEHNCHLYLRRARSNALSLTTRSELLNRVSARILEPGVQ